MDNAYTFHIKSAVAAVGIVFSVFVSFADVVTVSSVYDEATDGWIGNVTELTNALKNAKSGDTVLLQKGVYDLSSLTNAPMYGADYYGGALLAAPAGCAIVGGTGDPGDVILDGPGYMRIFRTAGKNAVIRDLTISGGNAGTTIANENYQHKCGGAIYIRHQNCVVSNCVIEKCTAVNKGGAVNSLNQSGSALYDCVIRETRSGNAAGIAYQSKLYGCTVTNNTDDVIARGLVECGLYRCYIADNKASRHIVSDGVAVDCIIERNESTYNNDNNEGIVFNSVVSNCVIRENDSYNGTVRGGSLYGCELYLNRAYNGGGIFCAESIEDCVIVSNRATYGGGIYCCSNVFDSVISFNYAGNSAGGAYDSVISNCTVEANAADYGGGIYKGDASGTVFSDNVPNAAYEAGNLIDCDLSGSGVRHVDYHERCRFHDISNQVSAVGNVAGSEVQAYFEDYPFFGCRKFRNCLFERLSCVNRSGNYNTAMFYFGSGANTNSLTVENCTFVSNRWQYVMRYYDSESEPATFVNCVFYRNVSNTSGNISDMRWIHSGYVYMTNCVLGVSESSAVDGIEWVNTQILGSDYEPGFSFLEDAPYEPKRSSILRGAGLTLDWMAEGKDLAGNPRLRDGKVDIGAYQCWLEPDGMMLLVR